MLPRLRRDRPAGKLMRSTAIALIAMVMPLGLDIFSDGDVSFGAPVAHAKMGRVDKSGGDRGNNGHGNGGEESQGEDPGSNPDPSNPGQGRGGGGSGGGGSGGGDGDGGEGSPGSRGSVTGSTPSVPGPSALALDEWFDGSAEPAGPDLTESEEQDLISRGWQ